MSESTHTPGPWVVGADPDGDEECQSVWTDVPGAINAEIAGRICEPVNAQLIAAAPDLLAAARDVDTGLQNAIELLTEYAQTDNWAADLLLQLEGRLHRIQAAIAKATGQGVTA